MPDLNGEAATVLSSTPFPISSAKRKREGSSGVNGDGDAISSSAQIEDQESRHIQDVWALLKARDPSSSILDRVAAKASKSHGDSKPSTKRAKISDAPSAEDIGTRLQRNGYESLQTFVLDVQAACSELLIAAESEGSNAVGTLPWKFHPDTVEQDRTIADLKAFTKFFKALTDRESKRYAEEPQEKGPVIKEEPGGVTDGSTLIAADQDGKSVLTLFGNGHKQLFSSFQTTIPRSISKDESFGSLALDMGGDIELPLRENGLPNAISSTKIIPVNSDSFSAGSARTPLLAEVFPPPSTLAPLSRPKTPKYPNRGSLITWTRETAERTAPVKGTYTIEKVSTGHWLGYSGIGLPEEITTPEAKRKQRDRALSTGESGFKRSDGARAAMSQAKDEALFCSVYSSFAPTRDDSSVLVPVEVKNDVWWRRVGSDLFDRVFAIEPSFGESVDESPMDIPVGEVDYQEAVDAYDPAVLELEDVEEIAVKASDDTLRRISQRLEVLHSYQRIRNIHLTSSSRASITQATGGEMTPGSPATPSKAEMEAYRILRAEIADLISTLPPYAVTKLNGDQLAELNVSRNILLESKDYTGLMEEDAFARAAKAAALSAAASTVNNTVGRPSASASYGGQQAQQSRTAAQRAMPGYSTTPAQPSLSRSSSNLRQNPNNWQAPAQNYGGNMQRPSYAQTPGYPNTLQTPRPMPTALGRPSAPLTQYMQRAHAQNQSYGGSYQTPTQPAYQQRAQLQSASGSTGYYRNPSQAPQQQSPQPSAHYQTQTPMNQQTYQGRQQQHPQVTAAQLLPQSTPNNQSQLNLHAQAAQSGQQ